MNYCNNKSLGANVGSLNRLLIEVLPILCFCAGIVPQKENAESVKIFSVIVKS